MQKQTGMPCILLLSHIQIQRIPTYSSIFELQLIPLRKDELL